MVFLTLNCNIFVGLKCKLKKDDLPKYGMIPSRWKSCKSDQNWVSFIIPFDHYLSSCVWHNSLIKIDNRPIFYITSWYSEGVENVTHLMKDSTKFISHREFEERFGTNFLAFQGVISAWKSLKQLNTDCLLSRNKICEDFHEQFLKTERATASYPRPRKMVWWLRANWKRRTNWLEVGYRLPFKCAKITKVITFQFKLLPARRLTHNDFLREIGIKNSEMYWMEVA